MIFNNDNNEFNDVFETSEQENAVVDLAAQVQKNIELQSQLARVRADLANSQRRADQDRLLWYGNAKAEVLGKLLPFLDELLLAIDSYKKINGVDEEILKGLSLIVQNFDKSLKSLGVREVTYDSFDPEFHEAVGYASLEGKDSGSIIEVLRKGFLLDKKVIRYAQVIVAQ